MNYPYTNVQHSRMPDNCAGMRPSTFPALGGTLGTPASLAMPMAQGRMPLPWPQQQMAQQIPQQQVHQTQVQYTQTSQTSQMHRPTQHYAVRRTQQQQGLPATMQQLQFTEFPPAHPLHPQYRPQPLDRVPGAPPPVTTARYNSTPHKSQTDSAQRAVTPQHAWTVAGSSVSLQTTMSSPLSTMTGHRRVATTDGNTPLRSLPIVEKFEVQRITPARLTPEPAPVPAATKFDAYVARGPDGKLIFRGLPSMTAKLETIFGPSCDTVEYIGVATLDSGRLLALDFDQTLVKVFLWKEIGDGNEMVLEQWHRDGRLLEAFGYEKRIQELRKVLTRRRDMGDLLCVLSSCTATVIRRALNLVGLADLLPDHLIFGSDTQPYGLDKAKRLTTLLDTLKREKGTLVDDDIRHCRGAAAAGHDALWVRLRCGLEGRDLERLLKSDWDSLQDLGMVR
eukprot:GEMP01007227.1.p1 GENE.GEMP01007227.1~~GEMP01007227.1.p1  ORF type:complete len:450 (+),score=83.94 GEMP01007227.1:185-1534(+)